MWRWGVVSSAVAFGACTSAAPAPSDTGWDLQATLQDAKLVVYARCFDINSVFTDLEDAQVSATFRGQTITLPYSAQSKPTGNTGSFDLASDVSADEVVAFSIAHGDTSATATGTMPADFTVSPPIDPKVGAPIDVTWSPTSTDAMTWSGYCEDGFDGPVPTDTGSIEFPPAVFQASPQLGCDATLTMTRTRTTLAKSDFAEVGVEVARVHQIAFRITP